MQITTLNTDLSKRVVINSEQLPWVKSPSPGVLRRPLERFGAESGRATSIVKYEPNSTFPSHTHPEGEEILVLEGTFSDEHGDYPNGTYILNPQGFEHAPRTREGCLIFVKLCQYRGKDRPRIVVDTGALEWQPGPAPGIRIKHLYSQTGYPETVVLMKLDAGATFGPERYSRGAEALILDGSALDGQNHCPKGTWIRIPPGDVFALSSPEGCTVYLKTNGLF